MLGFEKDLLPWNWVELGGGHTGHYAREQEKGVAPKYGSPLGILHLKELVGFLGSSGGQGPSGCTGVERDVQN